MTHVALSVSLEQLDERARLVVAGDLDSLSREDFVRAAIEALEASRLLEIDLSGVDFLDTVGLSGLVAVNNIARADGKAAAITSCSEQVARLLRLTGLSEMIRSELFRSELMSEEDQL
jgi:anti-sigma B factor antagonist